MKFFRSTVYNYNFNKEYGFFMRWGRNFEDDPKYSPLGPEILDIEISTICHRVCPWCYKSNSANGKNMSIETFKAIISKIPRLLTQIAFGIGDIDTNPDLREIMLYTRKKGYVPNITINGRNLTDDWANFLSNTCGAIAVSHYKDDECYNAVKSLTDRTFEQVNIHKLLADETYDSCYKLMNATLSERRLKKLNTIVFLSLKPKGNKNNFHSVSQEKFANLVNFALQNKISIGFDSCSGNRFLKTVEGHQHYEEYKLVTEPCESSCFSYYINVDGIGYPCSFLEGENGYTGIDLTKIDDFLKDVWYNFEIIKFRTDLLNNNRNCLYFKIYEPEGGYNIC